MDSPRCLTTSTALEEQFRRIDEQHLETMADENGLDSEWMTVTSRRSVPQRTREAVNVGNRFSFLDESPCGEIENSSSPVEEDQEDQDAQHLLEQENIVHSNEHPGAEQLYEVPRKDAYAQVMEEPRGKQARKKKRNVAKARDARAAEPVKDEDSHKMSKSSSLPELCRQESDFQCQRLAVGAANAVNAGAVAAFMIAANALKAAVDNESATTAKCRSQQKQNRRATRRAASLAPRNVQWQSRSQRGHRPQMQRPQMQRSAGPRR
mmetsp:Transcript_99397/g.172539  ORF Transcript_99397/g.172539 Transcript_99397/m.172539 type:complete len:265 (+) Transcript_99397:83-877(+)